jgi:hypothetical protein
MTAQSPTYQVETSYEATTLDYLSPHWYPIGEPFADAAEAEAVKVAAQAEWYAKSQEPKAFRVRTIPSQAQVQQWADEDAAANAQYWADRARAAEAQERARQEMFETFGRGKVVKVVKGRKVPVGTEGTVFWLGEDKYSRTGGYRVGFETFSGERHFTSLSNVEPVTGMVEVGV